MKYKTLLLIILSLVFSTNIYSNQKYISSYNGTSHLNNNSSNYQIAFSIKLSNNNLKKDYKKLNFERKTLKSINNLFKVILFAFILMPIALLTVFTGVPLLIVGCYRYYSHYPQNETNPFIISGGICVGGGFLFGIFSLFSLL